MPFAPGQSGNPSGHQKEKKFLAALERAIAQDDGVKLRKAAESLLSQAANGEPWAIEKLADRLDGKPSQSNDVAVTGDLTINLLSYGAVVGTDPPT